MFVILDATSAIISSTTAMNPKATINETTTFAVTITDANNTAGCESVQFVTIEVPATILTMEAVEDQKLCEEVEVTLAANITGNADIQWSTDADFSNVISTDASIT